ncbi:polysaccharide deacetylase family protein [Shimia sediminis]|uniref:polysaccharide deacetylase family protein n=1 Tax=Shimia sediminis TaxID=2497945 RepID=UPI000F8CAF22|nr:polysaccharide deacetylase family protein [Shimia sediminis]
MNVDWHPLRAEFELWRSAGLQLPFWWRDDDATEPTKALEELSSLATATAVPVHLAIIPRDATQELGNALETSQEFIPVVHGWAHENYAPPSLKKAEFGATREADDCVADLKQSLVRMKSLVGERLAPMFVPPWNRIDPALMTPLAEAGYNAVSTFLPRREPDAAPGLAQINTHLDPIHWRGTRGLVPPEDLVALIVALLKDRRRAITDNAEPFGYLTHHLVHGADIWEFSRQFLHEMCDGPIRLYRHDKKE